MMEQSFTGGCACGAVGYQILGEPVFMNHCQCRDCQRTSGTGAPRKPPINVISSFTSDIAVAATLLVQPVPSWLTSQIQPIGVVVPRSEEAARAAITIAVEERLRIMPIARAWFSSRRKTW